MTNSPHRARLLKDQAQLIVIDIQERLLPSIHDHEQVVAQAVRMIRAARTIGIPVTVSEQYPQGLGRTTPPVADAAGDAPLLTKMTFSLCADEACMARVVALGLPQAVLVGIETHVCVLQTALDLLALGITPFVPADAVGSRRTTDGDVALDGLRAAGAVVTTVESAIFQLVHVAGTDVFKRILPLVR